jgi:hypothetical protein
VLWKEEWAQETGGWLAGTVLAVSDGSLPNPNGPGRVTGGWAVVRYDVEGDCHVHLLDPKHHHDARGDREMAWRLQPPAQAAKQQQCSPDEVWEDWDVSSAASPWLPYSESSATTSGDEAKSGCESGGAGGAGMECSAEVCDLAVEGCPSGSLEEGSGQTNNAVETYRAAGELEATLPDMVRFYLACTGDSGEACLTAHSQEYIPLYLSVLLPN